jgi:hypothetical protein
MYAGDFEKIKTFFTKSFNGLSIEKSTFIRACGELCVEFVKKLC